MVSVLVQRQQREVAMRRERLLAARQSAAALSVQQARTYQTQKRRQEASVREDARQLWLQSHARDVAIIDGLVTRAAAVQGEAQEAAARHEANLQMEAYEEAAAWQAERQLEAARHRLAVAFTRTEAHKRAKPAREAAQRRADVRVAEKERAARVAASVSEPHSLSSVLASMQAAPAATHVPHASVPVPQRRRESVRAAASASADGTAPANAFSAAQLSPRRWRLSHVAPHVHVTLHRAPPRHATDHEDGELSALAVADATVPASADDYAEECVAAQQQRNEMLKEGQERAAQRAAAVLRDQHAKARLQQEKEEAQRERLATVKAHYRHPREESAANGDTYIASGSAQGAPDHRLHRPQTQRAPQWNTHHQQAYLKGEEEFRAAFVEAPPAVVRLDEEPPHRAPLSDLLRPVKVAELLYRIAKPALVDAAPPTPAPLDGSGAAAVRPPPLLKGGEMPPPARSSRARVLPSVPLRMFPFDYHCSSSRATAEPAPVDEPAATAPLISGEGGYASPPPAPRDASGTRNPSLHASAEASTALSAVKGDALVNPESARQTPSQEEAATAEELVALSPLTPAPRDASARGAQSPSSPAQCAGNALGEQGQTAASMGTAEAAMAGRQLPFEGPRERWATVDDANASVSSSMTERTPAHHRHRCSATPPSSLSSSNPTTVETAEPVSGSSSPYSSGGSSSNGSVDASTSSGSASTGASSRHRMPAMTAEQLKLALLRLRRRITSARM
ncbi:hypothetical protein LSCM1_07693 [Leishmania martiniquensis]|uniref:Uncharacterized protein n=1 Tax=Leishmania martiniquensis TaxID=1580590 RepID=A0A836KU35_9TRYP|nr:hypothetical protein LSCM1_07693 [Leishmania martiniquensis]